MEPQLPDYLPKADPAEKPKKDKKDKKDKKKKASRTVETLFRSLMSNHIQLSTLADRKANLMISVNALIVSVMATLLFKELHNMPTLLWPTVLLMVICLLTIIFAVLATKPSTGKPTTNVDPNDLDLLFFGDYTSLNITDYQAAMKFLVHDEALLHERLIANIYAQGKALERKYQRLKIAYTLFLYGFPFAIVLFLIVFLTDL